MWPDPFHADAYRLEIIIVTVTGKSVKVKMIWPVQFWIPKLVRADLFSRQIEFFES